MNKSELVAAVAEKLAGAEPDARQYVDAVFDTIMGQVSTGERVQIIGFGTFDSVERAARVGHNPRSRETIQVPASVAPRFQAGQTFRAQVKESLVPSAGAAAVKVPAAAVTAAVAAKQEPAAAKSAKTKAAKKTPTKKPEKAVKVTPKAEPVKAVKAVKAVTKAEPAKAVKAVKAVKPVKDATKAEPAKSKDPKAAAKKAAKPGKAGRK